MKTLHTTDKGVCLAIIDQNNYAIGLVVKDKKAGEDRIAQPSYFNSIADAVKALCKRAADQECTSLKDWLVEYTKAFDYYTALLQGI